MDLAAPVGGDKGGRGGLQGHENRVRLVKLDSRKGRSTHPASAAQSTPSKLCSADMPLLGIEAVPGRPSSAHFARFVVRFLLQDLHSGITSIKGKLSDYAGCGSLPASLERLLLGRIEADIFLPKEVLAGKLLTRS